MLEQLSRNANRSAGDNFDTINQEGVVMNNSTLEPIKNEITFFMEKTFQFSFVYIAALFATIAGGNADIIKEIASILGSNTLTITIAAILLLNLIYLIVTASCGFAIIKRGCFLILEQNNFGKDNTFITWEIFVRTGVGGFGNISWNVDNYYVILIYAISLLLSVGLFIYDFSISQGIVKGIIVGIFTLHIIPIWSIAQIGRLDKMCRLAMKNVTKSNKKK